MSPRSRGLAGKSFSSPYLSQLTSYLTKRSSTCLTTPRGLFQHSHRSSTLRKKPEPLNYGQDRKSLELPFLFSPGQQERFSD